MSKLGDQPAFPCQELDGQGNPSMCMMFGMTYRQWLVGVGMQGLLSNPEIMRSFTQDALSWGVPLPEVVATGALEMADAAIKELEKKQS